MYVLITYDVSTRTRAGRRRLRQVAKICEDHGQRVQLSAFECKLDHAQWIAFRAKLLQLIDHEQDSLRFYLLGNNWKGRIEHHGANPAYDVEGPLLA